MNIRWRISVALIQIALLCGTAWWAVGTPIPLETWFISGALGVVLALQFAEPFFTRPTDALLSGVSIALLVVTSGFPGWAVAWWVVFAYATLGCLVAIVSLVAPHESPDGRVAGPGRRAFYLVGAFAGKYQYSAIFLVAVMSVEEPAAFALDRSLIAIGGWAVVLAISAVRWDRLLTPGKPRARDPEAVSITAPARISVLGPDLGAALGAEVSLIAGRLGPAPGRVVRRTPHEAGVVTEVQLEDARVAEALLGRKVKAAPADQSDDGVLGVVAPGTTDMELVFDPLGDIEVGDPVWSQSADQRDVLFQVTALKIAEARESAAVSVDYVRAIAAQVGEVSPDGSISESKRILPPGALIRRSGSNPTVAQSPERRVLLGTVKGTELPVWIDPGVLVKGHTAILGMTGMGKSTFTKRLARELAKEYPVVILDQTGEYRELCLPAQTDTELSTPGMVLKDLDGAPAPHKAALSVLRKLESLGRAEYQATRVRRRVLIIEEAHQFVPEPSMLSYNQEGRDEAVQFGLLMMQVRKFGVSVILISQRTAVVAKSALSQCENIIAFKSVDQTGLDYFESFGGKVARQLLPRIGVGHAVAMGPAISLRTPVAVEVSQ